MTLAVLLRHYAGKSNKSLTVLEKLPQQFDDLLIYLDDWPDDWRESYEERAAIMEYDGGLTKSKAEKLSEIIQRDAYVNKV